MHHSNFFDAGNKVVFTSTSLPHEIDLRNAISRLYYYIYHEVLIWIHNDEILKNLYLNSVEKSKHKRLRSVLAHRVKESRDTSYGTISRLLGILHQARCDCDYNLDNTVDKNFYDSFIANFTSLKQISINLKNDIFNKFECTLLEEIATTKIGNNQIRVCKAVKPSLKILD